MWAMQSLAAKFLGWSLKINVNPNGRLIFSIVAVSPVYVSFQ